MKIKRVLIIIIPIIIIIIGVIFLIFGDKSLDGVLKEGKGFSTYEFDITKMSPQELNKVSDGYILISDINMTNDEDNDVRITKYDESFNKLWTYDYINDEQKYMLKEYSKEESKNLMVYVEKILEEDNKLFFMININSLTTGYENTRLLVLNSDGSKIDEHRFEESLYSMTSIKNNVITFYTMSSIYKYNYKTKKEDEYVIEDFKEELYEILEETDDEYLVASSTNNYIDGDKHVTEGTNSLYLVDKKFKVKKSLDLDKTMNVKGINYEDIRHIDERVYVSYFVNGDIDDNAYTGLLVIDKDFNVISNIKYTEEVTNKKFKESDYFDIYDFYVYNDELYVLVGSYSSKYVLIDKYDKTGKEISSTKAKKISDKGMNDGYTYYGYKVLSYDDKEVMYYVILSDDQWENKNGVHKSVLGFEKAEL